LVFATKYAYFKKRTTGPGEALSTAAQIAVTLAGFAGVVVVFRRESVHEWSPIDILPLGLCVTAILLLTIEPTLTGVWRWCSGAAFVVFGIRDRGKHEFSPPETTAVTRDGRQFHLLSIRDSLAVV
jgi:hypothetical protein